MKNSTEILMNVVNWGASEYSYWHNVYDDYKLYFREYFTDREKFASEQKNYPELAFLWSVHKEVIQEYCNTSIFLRYH